MASHNLDHQPEEVLITEIAELKRQISEMRTLQMQGATSLNYVRSAPLQQSIALSANSGGYFGAIISNPDGKSLFTNLESSFYQDSVSTANEIGSNLNNFRDLWDIDLQLVEHASTNSYVFYRLYFFNHQATPRTFIWIARGRWIVAGGSTGT